MDSGGLVVSWLSSCTTAWHNYRFDLCEFLRVFHRAGFPGQLCGLLLIFGDRTVDTFQQGYQVPAGQVGFSQTLQGSAAERPPSVESDADGGNEDKASKAKDEEKGLGGEDPRQTPAKQTSKETTIVRGLSLRNVLPHRVVVVVALVAWSARLGGSLNRGLGGAVRVLRGHRRSCRGAVGVLLLSNRSRWGSVSILSRSSNRGAVAVRSSCSRGVPLQS